MSVPGHDAPYDVPIDQSGLLKATLARLGLFLRIERKILGIIVAYALGIGLFALIVPLTVQEMTNTFAFAIQPIMIVTLAGVMAVTLIFIGALRVLQARAVEILVQRLYTRIALALTEQLPKFREDRFLPHHANRFAEAEFLPRALVAMLTDLINVAIGGCIGMTILVMYHPYFLLYNVILIGGFAFVVTTFGRGGLLITMKVSDLHYQTLNWLQDVAHNQLHFKSTASMPLLLKKTDEVVRAYVMARKTRSDILTGRQYKGAVLWQALGHSGLIATAGWLMAAGQLTLGQFVAAEVIVGALLIHLDTLARRMYALIYAFTSMHELATLFAHPRDTEPGRMSVALPDPTLHGVRLTCKDLSFAFPSAPPIFEHFNLDVGPGEKIALLSGTSTGKTTLALVLAGIHAPTTGVIRYNDVDLRDLDMESLNTCRGLVLDSRLTLFGGTLEENITMGRKGIQYEDIQWALRFAELDEEVETMPLGLHTPIQARGKAFTSSQILRILVARAVITRPQLLIFDGTLHNMESTTRDIILRRLCSKEEPWSVIFVSNDPLLIEHVGRRVTVA
ncbi:MAG: ATP-binding cassette domain-containing protein [Nitrospirae bacterium]|nr:MAG: ATP-binding cassette domain-containing protein [Nitrospirota bacterium]